MRNHSESKQCIYLHIGMPKTGSTSLQIFLQQNRRVLESKGYSYPALPFRYPAISEMRNGHFLVGEAASQSGQADPKWREEAFGLLQEELEKYPHLILSDEGIWNSIKVREKGALPLLRQFCEKNQYEWKVIVYLRRQDSFLESYWKQKVRRRGFTRSWEQMLHRPPAYLTLDYYPHLCEIAEIVGKDNLIVHRYGNEYFGGTDGTIFSDFLHAVGLVLTEEYTPLEKQANVSLNCNFAEIKRILNFLLPEEAAERERPEKWLEQLALDCSASEKKEYQSSLFSPEERRIFLEKYRESNEKTAREFLGQEILFTEEFGDLPKWSRDNPQQYEDTLYFVGMALMQQRKETEALRKQLQQMSQMKPGVRFGRKVKQFFCPPHQ